MPRGLASGLRLRIRPGKLGKSSLLPAGRCVDETRRLTPAMARTVLELLDLMGFDPRQVGEVLLTTDQGWIEAHVTHVPASPLHVPHRA